jgi:hypothetical protein
MHRVLRNTFFRLAKDDVREFIAENEERLVQIFCEELDRVDERLEEERVFIDIHMSALGKELMKGVFAALYRFLEEY